MDNNLFSYLTGNTKQLKKKRSNPSKPLKRKRKMRWGSKLGNKAAKDYSNKTSNSIDKLLTLVATQFTHSPHDAMRLKQIDSDFQIAKALQTKEDKILNDKEIDSMPDEARDRMIDKYKGYGEKFQEIEDNYKELITQFAQVDIISPEAVEDYRNHIDTFRTERDEIRTTLMEDIKENPHDLWEWKGFIENSELQIGNLINIEEDANRLLFDKIQHKQDIIEKQLDKTKKQVTIGETELEKERKTFNQEVLVLTEQLSQVQQDIDGIEMERKDNEIYTKDLREQLKDTRKQLTKVTRSESWIADELLAVKGPVATGRIALARMEPAQVVHQFAYNDATNYKNNRMLHRALEETGIGYPLPEQYDTIDSKKKYIIDRISQMGEKEDDGDDEPEFVRPPAV